MGRPPKYHDAAEKQAAYRARKAQHRLQQQPVVHGAGYTLYRGDCFDIFPLLAPHSVDLILADLPYGTTACTWDVPLPLARLWYAYARVLKRGAAVVLTAAQPFASALIESKRTWFRHDIIWEKPNSTNPLLIKHQPARVHESALVFCARRPTYHPQKTHGHSLVEAFEDPTKTIGEVYHASHATKPLTSKHRANTDGSRYPRSVQRFEQDRRGHPTQKPVEYMRWLIRSYSNPDALVLDNTMGSGTTGEACILEQRRFVGIELHPPYFHAAAERLAAVTQQGMLPLPLQPAGAEVQKADTLPLFGTLERA
jgi:site-specific DNA-methyltransferase (adenine-specific)